MAKGRKVQTALPDFIELSDDRKKKESLSSHLKSDVHARSVHAKQDRDNIRSAGERSLREESAIEERMDFATLSSTIEPAAMTKAPVSKPTQESTIQPGSRKEATDFDLWRSADFLPEEDPNDGELLLDQLEQEDVLTELLRNTYVNIPEGADILDKEAQDRASQPKTSEAWSPYTSKTNATFKLTYERFGYSAKQGLEMSPLYTTFVRKYLFHERSTYFGGYGLGQSLSMRSYPSLSGYEHLYVSEDQNVSPTSPDGIPPSGASPGASPASPEPDEVAVPMDAETNLLVSLRLMYGFNPSPTAQTPHPQAPNLRTPSDDLNATSDQPLATSFALDTVERISEDLYVFKLPPSPSCKWVIGVDRPTTASSEPEQLNLPYADNANRFNKHQFTTADFDSAMLEGTVLQGSGIVGRIAREFGSKESGLQGPSIEVTVHHSGYFVPSKHDGYFYWDDDLTGEEIACLCGTYCLYTGRGEQTTTVSWFPPPDVWDKQGYGWPGWTETNEEFFQQWIADIRKGNAKPLSRQNWWRKVRSIKNTRSMLKNNRERAKAYVELNIHAM
ncbi:unnamed protein product [Cyclocybe aegerita]|uniref:Uncharacterized protein n=1 Tax=Cyclocybe aegerita TaxID=1973307 RepID=A0A8S0WLT7_CYCAE|nr:unnamed protein product [Cyclocybe aegerita]